jgi:hypothetical protein
MAEEWSESCGVTGLEIRPGDGVLMFLLDPNYATEDGPTKYYGFACGPLRGTYTGQGAVEVTMEDGTDKLRAEIMRRMAGVGMPRDFILGPHNLSHGVWLVGQQTFEFLPDLPLQDPDEADSVRELADGRLKQIREAVLPFVGSEGAGRQPDPSAAYTAWGGLGIDVPGACSFSYRMDEFAENEERAEALIRADWEVFVARRSMYECRRMLVPSMGIGLEEGGYKAVSELARYTRRKAIHAGFEPA